MPRLLKIILIQLGLIFLMVSFQNCSAKQMFSAESSSQKDSGNGGTYDGKLTFLEIQPGFTCEMKSAPKSILRRVAADQWRFTENRPEKCGYVKDQVVTGVNIPDAGAGVFTFNGNKMILDNSLAEGQITGESSIKEFTVNGGADANSSDSNLGDGLCANALGLCSLKAAFDEIDQHKTTSMIINIPAGTFNLTWSIHYQRTAFTGIYGAGKNNTIISGGDQSLGLFISGLNFQSTAILQGLTLQNGRSMEAYGGGGLEIIGNAYLKDIAIKNNLQGTWALPALYAGTSAQHVLIEDSEFSGNQRSAIGVWATRSFIIENSIINANGFVGIHFENATDNIKIFNSQITNNIGHGVAFYSCSFGCLVESTNIASNGGFGIEFFHTNMPWQMFENLEIKNSSLIGNTMGNIYFNARNASQLFIEVNGGTMTKGAAPNCVYDVQNTFLNILLLNAPTIDDASCI